jgi:hypothetical protein
MAIQNAPHPISFRPRTAKRILYKGFFIWPGLDERLFKPVDLLLIMVQIPGKQSNGHWIKPDR